MLKPEFYVGGKLIDFVNKYAHLGHIIISDYVDDKHDILCRRNTLCGKINNVNCFFCQQNPAVKLRLMCRYCSDHYGMLSGTWSVGAKDLDVRDLFRWTHSV